MRVVILGGGYTAIWCYRALRRWMGSAADIVVVAPFTQQVFHGFTGEVLDGELAPGLQTSPLEECVPHARRVQGWATAVDAERREVRVEWQGETTTVAYDELVIATGAHDRTDPVPGLAEHGWALRFPGNVPALLDHLALLEAEPAADDRDADRRATIVVVGAGFAGTEVAAALGRRYGSTRRVVLVSSADTVVPVWRDRLSLQEGLRRNLDEAGVEVLTGARVVAVDAGGVVLGDGSRIASATVVSTLGNAVPAIPGLEDHQEQDGLLRVDDCLRVTDGVWSAGDAAAVRHGAQRAPKEALWAIRAGTRIGRNIARSARRARPRRFGYRGLGTVAAFAPGHAVATVWGVPLPQLVGYAVRAVLFLWFVPSRRTALRILRWSLSSRTVATPVPIRVAAEAPRPLVGIEGGLTAASRLREAVAADGTERRAAGA
ncbi:NAD(P)/FAD-dependent oxidoreductase [Amnibacterium endophyticum]|uniref:NAD(P)/FAD-dependent oxidoreductase n=1 Tax=Amnibacterium endophyticum TaxID=2109337 RepID=A0ABW4LB29_9MICO